MTTTEQLAAIYDRTYDFVAGIIHGTRNLIRWFPIIWGDRNWDWEYLARIMIFKLRMMEKDMLSENKVTVRQNNALTTVVKSRLRNLYEDEGWLAANLYHHQLFGSQIAGSV